MAPTTVLDWFRGQGIVLAVILASVGVILLVLAWSAYARRRRMAEGRAGEGLESFVATMTDRGFEPHIARMAYVYMEERLGIDYPVLPDDQLDRDLGFSEEEVADMLHFMMYTSERVESPMATPNTLDTISDVIERVQTSPVQRAAAA